jgi:hypothetical protein
LQEEATDDKFVIDWRRVAVTSMFGIGFVGPVGHFWYVFSFFFCFVLYAVYLHYRLSSWLLFVIVASVKLLLTSHFCSKVVVKSFHIE